MRYRCRSCETFGLRRISAATATVLGSHIGRSCGGDRGVIVIRCRSSCHNRITYLLFGRYSSDMLIQSSY
ncbi:Hypothetical predicted protein [Octopus vulgaris]|uniref:Uncharacterized protein n=1 Tax=Octopus vulgaris TaxID=6645 RepID=A0AA36BHC6_OCTVU|nr:Hypothetical predicted protein [Octopus vulgaris]